ncbi:MAG: response regulator [Alphaproteobacteria bacterium]|nr:response regulator [Alphaproteobacteria bacterium]
MLHDNTILLVEDTLSLARTYEEYLKAAGYSPHHVACGNDALDALAQSLPSAVVLDIVLPDISGIKVLKKLHASNPEIPVVIITAHGSVNVAVEAMREGAFDFIVKPFPAARLQVTLKNALSQRALRHEVRELRQALDQEGFYDFIGKSPAMQAVYRIIDSVAASKASVFITGESGTGKELAAQAVHKASPRRAAPFIAMNCAAIPHELLESHIFGHIKGSFTGAVGDQIGAGKAADGGTLFLDEVGEMPLELQVKLLRFIQTGEVQQIGSTKAEKVDVRIVAATNRDPMAEVKAGNFREDLYYRLHVVPVDMPPLRERDDDIIILALYFLAKFAREEGKGFTALTPAAEAMLRRHDWPGNVRELENVMRNVVVLHNGPAVTPAMLPEALQHAPVGADGESANGGTVVPQALAPVPVKPLWLTEKEAIMNALVTTGQEVPRAAALLEVSPSTLYRKLQAWKSLEQSGN